MIGHVQRTSSIESIRELLRNANYWASLRCAESKPLRVGPKTLCFNKLFLMHLMHAYV